MKIIEDWKNILIFIKSPSLLDIDPSKFGRARLVFSAFLLKIFLTVILGIGFVYLLNITEANSDYMGGDLQGLYHPIVLFSLIAIIEELSFRGFLSKFNPILFAVSVAGLSGILFKKIVYRNMLLEYQGLPEMIAVMAVVGVAFYFFARVKIGKLTVFWQKNFKAIVIASSVLFGLVHFLNSQELRLEFLPTTISQILGGFVLSYVRLRSGLLAAILFHFIWNIMLGL